MIKYLVVWASVLNTKSIRTISKFYKLGFSMFKLYICQLYINFHIICFHTPIQLLKYSVSVPVLIFICNEKFFTLVNRNIKGLEYVGMMIGFANNNPCAFIVKFLSVLDVCPLETSKIKSFLASFFFFQQIVIQLSVNNLLQYLYLTNGCWTE